MGENTPEKPPEKSQSKVFWPDTDEKVAAALKYFDETAKTSGKEIVDKAKKFSAGDKGMETEHKDEPIAKEKLNELTEGFHEVTERNELYNGIIETGKKQLIEKNGQVDHGIKSKVADIRDGVEYTYIYLRDNFHTPKDRLFKSEVEKEVSVNKFTENEYASANLEEGYIEYTGEKSVKIINAVKGLLEGNPPSTIVDLKDLVKNNLLSKKERKKIDGDILYAVKLKGKIRLFMGTALT